ncbi:MAG: GNAT family N-acetyltransferase [Bacteroidales bacterium]|nr:GNAT family N-acetyltransferase [Bacteroidales bacterium]
MAIIEKNKLITLSWDTQFFGYQIAQVSFDNLGINIIDNIIYEIKAKKIRLTYFIVLPDDLVLNKIIEELGGILVDRKTLFSKRSQPHNEFKNKILEFEDSEPDENLIELALEAGLFSRFRKDSNFKNSEYERLYREWLINSLNKKIAFKTLVAVNDGYITGLTTLGEKNQHADIGLVAVNKKFGGQGIGTDLIRFADNLAYEMNFSEIKVVTQLQNTPACNLYKKCNFEIESIVNIYHFWQI